MSPGWPGPERKAAAVVPGDLEQGSSHPPPAAILCIPVQKCYRFPVEVGRSVGLLGRFLTPGKLNYRSVKHILSLSW